MSQTLVLHERFYKSLEKASYAAILQSKGFATPAEFLNAIINKLNDEFSFLEIKGFRFLTKEESSRYSQYAAFVDGDNLQHDKIVVFFTPIDSKIGDVIIEQGFMPTICNQMEDHITFLLDGRIRKIAVLTSQINKDNEISTEYNKMQMDVNSLNTLNFDVVPFFPIKNLSTKSRYNSLSEYMEMSEFLQKKLSANAQNEYLKLDSDTLYGDFDISQYEGQFLKSFCFRFLTAMLAGGSDYKYDISNIIRKLNNKLDNQFSNLKNFIDYANNNLITQLHFITPIDDDIIESDDVIDNINDMHRLPEKGIDNTGRKRYKTQKKVRDAVLKNTSYLCDCHDLKHFYFESVDLNNYVEGHHIVPMNRQEDYYFGKNINLDIAQNIVAICPTCHCQIHLGSRQARLKILSELYVRNKAKLVSFDSALTLALLASYYNIGLEKEEEIDWLKRANLAVAQKYSKVM